MPRHQCETSIHGSPDHMPPPEPRTPLHTADPEEGRRAEAQDMEIWTVAIINICRTLEKACVNTVMKSRK